MTFPFIKAQAAGNDFLFTCATHVKDALHERLFPEFAKAICDRQRGVGADGWYWLEQPAEGAQARIRLWNADGSYAELSGNGTRCAAAILVHSGMAGETLSIQTGSGVKTLRLLRSEGVNFEFEMEVGEPRMDAGGVKYLLPLREGYCDVTLVDVGNPQCAVPVDTLDFDWKPLGAQIEGHPQFPHRSNVSFIVRVDDHTIDARFYERGAGATLSSGTGATGAAIAAILRGWVHSPVRVNTEGGPLEIRWDGRSHPAYLTGPASVIAEGSFHWR